jgi:hypothetical protein
MCPPTYFDVTYSINPWMDPNGHSDHGLALYGGGDVQTAIAINEAEGDFAVLSRSILAGCGFRTTPVPCARNPACERVRKTVASSATCARNTKQKGQEHHRDHY